MERVMMSRCLFDGKVDGNDGIGVGEFLSRSGLFRGCKMDEENSRLSA